MAKKEEKKISIFGEAKVKSSGSKPKDDKEVVYIDGLESKLLELQFLKAQIADLEAQLVGVTDEIKTISKEKFVELYQSNRSNPNTFLIKDGEGCVMVIPTDRYISIKDEDRANQLIEEYGDDIITIDEKYYFNSQILERNMSAIEKIIMDAKTISDDDKRNLLVKEVKYSISKGYIDNLAVYGNKIETVIDDIQPIITLKNCGGKMEEGGELDSDFIATIYENGGGVQTFINSSDDISWLKENHLQDLEYENFNSAIIYGNEDSPEKIELFEKLEPLYTDTPTTFILKDDYSGYEKVFEKGGFLGGIFGGGRTYKKGLAYKLDRAKHNKSEDWEVPLKNRKRYANGGGVETLYDVISYDDNDRMVDSYYGVSEQEADEIKKSLEENYESAGVDNYVSINQSKIKTSKEATEKYNKSVRDLYERRRFESGQEDDDYANGGGVGFDWNKAMKIANKLKVIKDRLADARAKGNPELVKKLVEEHEYYGSQLDAMNMRTNKMANGGGVDSWSKEIEVVALSQSGTRGYAVYDTMTNRRAINKDGSYEFDDGEISEIIGEKNMDAFYDGQDKFKPKKKLNFDIFANGGGVGGSYGVNYNIVFEKPDSDMAWKETINASSEKEARAEFKKKHPTCTILNIFEAYANGGGVEDYDYYGSMTDESVVMQNCSNGEIHCDILEEIIGSKPEYPYQQVGSIRLQKCYLRPYYKIS